jgi:hypothetical protein
VVRRRHGEGEAVNARAQHRAICHEHLSLSKRPNPGISARPGS